MKAWNVWRGRGVLSGENAVAKSDLGPLQSVKNFQL